MSSCGAKQYWEGTSVWDPEGKDRISRLRLGAEVNFISKVGDDNLGDLATKTLDTEGVDRRFLTRTTEHATGTAAIIVEESSGEMQSLLPPEQQILYPATRLNWFVNR
jgi:sugar/nucleoside kinase (ribokinase family)